MFAFIFVCFSNRTNGQYKPGVLNRLPTVRDDAVSDEMEFVEAMAGDLLHDDALPVIKASFEEEANRVMQEYKDIINGI